MPTKLNAMGRKSSTYTGVTLFKVTGRWRAQISLDGKTTSLGDYDMEIQAARVYDLAAIYKHGSSAHTNFPAEQYESDLDEIQNMSQNELVALLRHRARKAPEPTSHYRGVSLMKTTGKWHAQAYLGGKEVHLGYYTTEEEAGRVFDRVHICRGIQDGSLSISTNFSIGDYIAELDTLARLQLKSLSSAFRRGSRQQATAKLLSKGFHNQPDELFRDSGITFAPAALAEAHALAVLRDLAERVQHESALQQLLHAKQLQPDQGFRTQEPLTPARSSRLGNGQEGSRGRDLPALPSWAQKRSGWKSSHVGSTSPDLSQSHSEDSTSTGTLLVAHVGGNAHLPKRQKTPAGGSRASTPSQEPSTGLFSRQAVWVAGNGTGRGIRTSNPSQEPSTAFFLPRSIPGAGTRTCRRPRKQCRPQHAHSL